MKTKNKNGYVSGVLLSNNLIREMRKHIEYEKFVARMLVDNETTREFKKNTEELNDGFHRFIYNNEFVDRHTAIHTNPNIKLNETIDETETETDSDGVIDE